MTDQINNKMFRPNHSNRATVCFCQILTHYLGLAQYELGVDVRCIPTSCRNPQSSYSFILLPRGAAVKPITWYITS